MSVKKEVQIGKYTISDMPDGNFDGHGESIWIENEVGEGGQFRIKTLEPIIDQYWKDHF
jgi:hypothetical protein